MTQYNRHLAMNIRKPDALPLDKSALGTFGAAEALGIIAFVRHCEGDATTYCEGYIAPK